MNTQLPDLRLVAIGDLTASKTNPRKNFAAGPLAELAESLKTQGMKQPILARPSWCIGANTQADLDLARHAAAGTPERWEIVAGERRYRAAKLVPLDAVPVLNEVMTDWQALEIQVVENLQRADLTEIEEAESYQQMLALKTEGGEPRYTVPALAERFGVERSQIYRRLKLLDLPEAGRAALESGELGTWQALLVARVPDPKARVEALKLVLTPQHGSEPLTVRETRAVIAEKFMVGLKGAPFKLDDASLLPSAGACTACPKNTDNCGHLFAADEVKDFAKKKVCCDPTCYRAKLDAVWKARAAAAEAEGKKILSEAESSEIYYRHADPGEMSYSSPYVELNTKPLPSLLKPEVEKVDTWRKLVEEAEKRTGQKVPRVLARDQAGQPRELVLRELAVVAIETGSAEEPAEPIFAKRVSSGGGSASAFDKERKALMEAAKRRLAEALEGMTQLHAGLVAKWEPSPIWEALLPVAAEHAGADGLWLIAKWQGLKLGLHGADKDAVCAKWWSGLLAAERQALVPLLLMGSRLKNSGPDEQFEAFAAAAGLESVTCDAISAAVKRNESGEAAKKAGGKEPKKKKEKVDSGSLKFDWNEHGVAQKPYDETPTDAMPEGTRCVVCLAKAPDGDYRFGLDLQSRTEGKAAQGYAPNITGKKYRSYVDAMVAGFAAALPFFKDDPAAFKVVAWEVDSDVAAQIAAEGEAPVEEDREKLAEWVKAYTNGALTIEEIARSNGAPLADVMRALEVARVLPTRADAQAELDAAFAKALPGCAASSRAKILAKYILRVCGKIKPEEELTAAELTIIAGILKQAAAAKAFTKAEKAAKAAKEAA